MDASFSPVSMDPSRRDYFRQAQTLQRQLGALLVVGLLVTWLKANATSGWLELLCVVLLLACGAGLFIVSARLFTRHHPVLSVFSDRLWFRGLREQVVMLRRVSDARLGESRVAGWTRRWIELRLGDSDADDADDDEAEQVRISLDALEGDPDEVLGLIRERASLQRELQPVR
jgi:hypothetical protein